MARPTGRTRTATRRTCATALAGALLAACTPAVALAATPRTIEFSGHIWRVKSSEGSRVGPGPNVFSSRPANVWVDVDGRLHLRITRANGRWRAAEVVSTASFGHGTYRWVVDSPVGGVDPDVVLGLFTWSDAPDFAHREIDVEIARWGNGFDLTNAQFAVQPYETLGHLRRFRVPVLAASTAYELTWRPREIAFRALAGADPSGGWPLASFTFAGPGVPPPGGENTRMNLWLRGGLPPAAGREVEVVIRSFTHTPPDA